MKISNGLLWSSFIFFTLLFTSNSKANDLCSELFEYQTYTDALVNMGYEKRIAERISQFDLNFAVSISDHSIVDQLRVLTDGRYKLEDNNPSQGKPIDLVRAIAVNDLKDLKLQVKDNFSGIYFSDDINRARTFGAGWAKELNKKYVVFIFVQLPLALVYAERHLFNLTHFITYVTDFTPFTKNIAIAEVSERRGETGEMKWITLEEFEWLKMRK